MFRNLSFKSKVLIPITAIFILSVLVITINNYMLLNTLVKTKTDAVLNKFTDNILMQMEHLDIILTTTKETLNEKHIAIAKTVAEILNNKSKELTFDELLKIAEPLDIIELNIVNANGIITKSTIPSYIGFDYKSTETTIKYMLLASGTLQELTEEPRASVLPDGTGGQINHYTGVARVGGGFIQLGFNASVIHRLQEEINIQKTIKETGIAENGFGMVVHNGTIIASSKKDLLNSNVSEEDWYNAVRNGEGFAWITIDDVQYYSRYKNANGHTIIGLLPATEYYTEINHLLFKTLLFVFIALIVVIVVLYTIMHKLLKPIEKITSSLGEIAKGKFEARVEGNYSGEFALIKNAVNDMAINITLHLNDKLKAERQAYEAELSKLELLVKVHKDSLTEVYNRRYLDENLELIIKLLSRSNSALSVIMVDVDYFKQYNDIYGHKKGDECLKTVAKTIKDSLTRAGDFVGRYGGEEFYIVLPNTGETGAKQIAEKLLANIRNLKIKHETSAVASDLTISLGVASGRVMHTQDGDTYVRRADEALYLSKQNGRNRYTFLQMDI